MIVAFIMSAGDVGWIYLPDTNNSVGDEDEQDDERLNKSCDGVIVFKEGQDLRWRKGYIW